MRAPERPRARRGLLAATTFLTRLPLGRASAAVTEADLRTGATWFPAVGGAIGVVAATAGWLCALRTPAGVAAVVAVFAEVGASGALHLDGLADTADGLGAASAGRDPLAAMREPGLGAFGVATLVLDLALRIATTAALLDGSFPWAIVAAGAASRFAPIALAGRTRYLRPNDGRGVWLRDPLPALALGVAGVTAVALVALAGVSGGVAIAATAIVVVLGVAVVARRAFGGVTGDALGASVELTQTLGLLAAVVVLGR
jgi:adenosylcobinamide-GDP ribazoletransferase